MAATAAATGKLADAEHESIRLGSYDAMVHRAGDPTKPALVFLHGGGPGATGWSNWQYALETLGARYFCLAPDFVGFGDSAHPDPAPRDMRVWTRIRIEQVVNLLDAFGVERANLIGNSLGGALSLHLLMEHPARFERAVLMGPAGGPSSQSPRQEVIKMVTFYNDPSPEALARLYSWFVHDPETFAGDLEAIARDRFALTMRADVKRSYEAQFSGPLHLALPESALHRIQHPVLLVHGRDDAVNPVEDSVYFQRMLPNAELHVFGKCGHWTQLEYPERFHRLIDAFFTGAL